MLQVKKLQDEFKKRVIGQDHIFEKLSDVIRRGEAGFSPNNEPKGAFLFLGPTGTGKTETAKTMAERFCFQAQRQDWRDHSAR